jgi:hypothetical protein
LRSLLLLVLLFCGAARADLYRWVDPQSGSVKYSSVPPPWHGDSTREAVSPKVEVISSQPKPPPAPVAAPVKPAPPPGLGGMEVQWRSTLDELAGLPERPDYARLGESIQKQIQAYEAMREEIDRADPAGAVRRRAAERGVVERLKRGLEARAR